MLERVRNPVVGYGAGALFLALAVGLRWTLDPWMDSSQPFALMFGAVALTVWVGGAGPASIVAIIGYLLCNWLFIEPRGIISMDTPAALAGLATYFVSQILIIAFGVGVRSAHTRAAAESQRAAEVLRRAAHSQHLLVELHDATRGLADANDVVWEIARRVGSHFAVSRCVYADVDAKAGEVSIFRDYVQGVPSVAGRHSMGAYSPELTEAYRRGETVVIEDTREDARTRAPEVIAALDKVGVGALVGVPLLKDGQLAGLLGVHHKSARRWAKDDVELIEQVAQRTWFAVESARAQAALRESEERSRTMADALRVGDRRKDEFLATLAHELRNPLAPIRNAVEILRMKDGADPQLRVPREIIDRQVRHLTRLVDDLLEVSRITQGKMSLRKEPIELAGALNEAIEAARPMLTAGGHELTVDLGAEPIRMLADSTRVTQMVLNLLNNAAKYTPKGGHVWLTVRRDGGEVTISVRDNGIGIDAANLPELFRMFSQITPALDRAQGGLGIGLALVWGLAELHGGSVRAHSEGLGKGSEFVLRLPCLEESHARGRAESMDTTND